jgi:uncharacterized protein with von Willebrand factor type A (vWA) domain
MTQEQDIVERLQDRAKFYDDSADCPVYFEHDKFLDIEAAQTITALRAERDELREANHRYAQSQAEATASCTKRRCATKERDRDEAETRAEAAEARVKELEDECEAQCDRRLEQMERGNTAIRERDEARKALEPFAKQADRYDPVEGDDDHPLWGAHTLTIGDVRRARSASSNREGGE